MEKEISPILVAHNSNLKPYIEIFQYHPENIIQQPLGTLIGFFEIRDYSEDSAYVVNFLNSVLKKEYYLNPKRPVQESLDAALHKINIALSELAKHGNVNWLGKLDSAICILEKNSVHFSVTGDAKILLSRKSSLTDITEGLAPDLPELHPLKTFVNVSSGRLEKNDKLIITSTDLFSILSISDLKKNLERFDKEKFVQFMKTALTNELDLAGTIIVDITEPKKIVAKKEKLAEASNANVFSEKAFKSKNKSHSAESEKKTILDASLEAEESVPEKEYTDKKTGHIYIQGNDGEIEKKNNHLQEQAQIAQEMLFNASYGAKEFCKRQSSCAWKKLKKAIAKIFSYDYDTKINLLKDKIANKYQAYSQAKKEKQAISQRETPQKEKMALPISVNTEKLSNWSNEIVAGSKNLLQKLPSVRSFGILPSFPKLKNIFPSMTTKQKLIAFSLLFLIVIAPLAFSKISFQKEPVVETENITPDEAPVTDKYSQEKNIVFVEQAEKIKTLPNVIDVFPLNDSLYAVTKDKLVVMTGSDSQEFSWPEENGAGMIATYMKDLNLIFILTDKNKVLSFSPISLEIKDNVIEIPADSEMTLAGTYLTYLYILDAKNDQVYRYPRAEGGFANKTDWLKEKADLSNANDIAISDNVYLAIGDGIKQYFQGKATDFSTENSQTPISFSGVFTNIDMENIYALDTLNSRLIQFDKDGKIIKQYHNEAIGSAENFSIDEKNKKAYLILPDEIDAIKLEF